MITLYRGYKIQSAVNSGQWYMNIGGVVSPVALQDSQLALVVLYVHAIYSFSYYEMQHYFHLRVCTKQTTEFWRH